MTSRGPFQPQPFCDSVIEQGYKTKHQDTTLIDLFLVSGQDLVSDVAIGNQLEHSDLEETEFKHFVDSEKTSNKTSTLYMGRVDFRLLGNVVSKVPWVLAEGSNCPALLCTGVVPPRILCTVLIATI